MAEFKLPELGENITQGTVTKILVKSGDAVKKGQNILELETDKAVLEVPCDTDGIVNEVLIKSGSIVKVGQSILKLSGSSATSTSTPTETKTTQTKAEVKPEAKSPPEQSAKPSVEEGTATSAPSAAPAAQPIASAAKMTSPAQAPAKVSEPVTNVTASTPAPAGRDIPAAPSVRLLARELGIDLTQVPGSGRGGRISNEDVKAYCKMLNTSRPAGVGMGLHPQPLPNFSKWGPVRREAMNNVRKKTAEHLSHAWGSIPHVTQFDKADITELEKFRKSISGTKTATPKKISVTPFIIKVAAAALKKFPQFNSSIDMASQEIIFKDYVNIGVAVDTDRGLLVPVLKNVDKMSIMQISDELTAMAERARLRKTTIEEMQGGCFSISNLGGIGGSSFTPIVNWPEVAILGVSRGSMEQAYIDGNFVPRLMLPLSLSYDHRIIDGADGARFIRWVCEAMQQPFLLDLNQ